MCEKSPQMQNRVTFIACRLKPGSTPHRQVFTEDEGDNAPWCLTC